MNSRLHHTGPDRSARFSRPAEKLVLEGIRRSSFGDRRSMPVAETALLRFFRQTLSDAQARAATAAMLDFVEALGWCAVCPLHTGRPDADPNRDEVLIVGLIAAIQNGDGRAVDLCLHALTCANRCDAVAIAAGAFALIMRSFGKTLLPMPASLISEAIDQSARRDTHPPAQLH
jgi:hypothetical protein